MQWLNCTLVTGASPLTEQWDKNPVQLSSLDVGTRVSHYPTPTSSIVSLYISILSLFVLINLLSRPNKERLLAGGMCTMTLTNFHSAHLHDYII